MKQNHLNFCRQHEWGTDARLVNGVIENLRDVTVDAAGKVFTQTVSFSNWHQLLAWAGY